MRKMRKKYTQEFKLRAVKMLENRGEKTIEEIAGELGISENMLYEWRKQHKNTADAVFLKKDPLLNELERLRKENEDLKLDKEILKKALAIFSRHGKS